ncbi:MAG: hypothetical protein OER80_04370 [Gammaproteobacteria bacterium]|nr:hypothetical protein [Gammaproteobacteria bacterium]MDH3767615.1 hypothetical protein [Gammaproteobacteria bacterium]
MLSSRFARLCVLGSLLLSGCAATPPATPHDMDRVAEEYVRLVLALGLHDPDFVDAYHGPKKWRKEAERRELSLDGISIEAGLLRSTLSAGDFGRDKALIAQRRGLLLKQLTAVQTRSDQLRGKEFSFDQEARLLYDARAPKHTAEHFAALRMELDAMLPGQGSLAERRSQYRESFVIPADRLDAVFAAAIQECRKRTLEHIALPEGERFVVEYVNDKPWSGYNWFQGGAYSLIQLNTDLPIHIDRAVDLACHEGYPGHHVFNTLLERELVKNRGWMEFSVYPLFSPMSLIAEGSANFGIDMAFPDDERAEFEREVLFPLAGLDASRVEEYYAIEDVVSRLNYAGNEAARRYLDKDIDAAAAVQWLQDYSLMSKERAEQRLKFIEKYRAYVINYNLGKDLVRNHVEAVGGNSDARWDVFEKLLSTPISASMLNEN